MHRALKKVITFTTTFSSDNIDKAKGVIKNVSLISLGVVQSHDCVADAKTLASVLACAKKAKKVRCKLDHGNSAGQIIGSLSKFRLSANGQKVLGDLQLLKSSPSFHYVLELAETLASGISLSIAFTPEFEKGANGSRLVRCTELFSVDVVLDGAANSGLFDASPVVGGPTVGQSLVGINTASTVAIPTGHKIKGTSVGAVCPQCEKTTQFLSKLVALHDDAAVHLEELCATFQPKDNVSSEQEFQRRLESQRLELEKGLEAKASIMACRLLGATGVKLSRVPDADTTNNRSDILDKMSNMDPTAQGLFYQANREAVQAAFQKRSAKNVQLENQMKTTAGVA